MYLQKVKFSLKDFIDPRNVDFNLEEVTKSYRDEKLIKKNGYYYDIFKMDNNNVYSKCYLDPGKKFQIIEENYNEKDDNFITLEVLVNE